LRNGDSAVVALSGVVPEAGTVSAQLRGSHLPLADIGVLAKFARPVKGLGDFDVRVSGTKTKPTVTANASLGQFESGALKVERVAAAATFADKRWEGGLDVFSRGISAVKATASFPMDLELFKASIPRDSVRIRINADSADLGIVQSLLAKTLDSTFGRMTAQLQFGGKWEGSFTSLTPSGTFTINHGQSLILPLGITLTDLTARARFEGNTLLLDTLSASSRPGRPGNFLSLKGSVANVLDSAKRAYDLSLTANAFHAVDRKTKAKLDVSVPRMRLTGGGEAVTLDGKVVVDRGQVFLPDPEIARKQLLDVSVDASGTASTGGGTDVMLQQLGLRSVAVNVEVGEDVKLKSAAADVKLAGSVDVGLQRTDAARGSGRPLYRLTVDGALQANTGTYTLDLGLARRDFTVTRGLVTFDASTNPDIDISAIYRVKRSQKEDIGIIVNVKGPLQPGPKIEFASDQTYDISQSDLLSYLITNEPGFDFTTPGATQALAFIAPTLSSIAASALRDRLGLGSVFDQVQFQGAATSSTTAGSVNLQRSGQDFLYGATLSGQRQVGTNVFFSVNAGLCPFTQNAATLGLSPLDALGGTFEYRFKPTLSLQASVESSSQARYCTSGASITSLAPRDRQLSLVLRRTWRF
jgi:hypothetical protein